MARFVRFEAADRGGVMTKWEGKFAFPERRGVQPAEGEVYEVLSAMLNPKGTVYFLRLGRKIETEAAFSVPLPSGGEFPVRFSLRERKQYTDYDGRDLDIMEFIVYLPKSLFGVFAPKHPDLPYRTVMCTRKSGGSIFWHQCGAATGWHDQREGETCEHVSLYRGEGERVAIMADLYEKVTLAEFVFDFESLQWRMEQGNYVEKGIPPLPEEKPLPSPEPDYSSHTKWDWEPGYGPSY